MSNTEVITAAEATSAELQARAETINETIDLIAMHEDAFEESTLEPRLIIGLEIARAKEAFGMSKAEAGAIGGSNARRAVLANPLGFSGWLRTEIPRLNDSTARKYATAFSALGLDTKHATPAQIRAKVKDLRHVAGRDQLPAPSLGALYKEAKPAREKPPAKLNLPQMPDAEKDEAETAELESLHIIRDLAKFISNGRHQILTKSQIIHLDQQLLAAREVIRPFTK